MFARRAITARSMATTPGRRPLKPKSQNPRTGAAHHSHAYRAIRMRRSRGVLDRPIEFLARGTSHWTLRLWIPVPSGRYLIRADAVDRLRHHQPRTAVSVISVRVA